MLIKSTRQTNIVLSKKVHVLVFYPLLNWKMHGETMKHLSWFLLENSPKQNTNQVSVNISSSRTLQSKLLTVQWLGYGLKYLAFEYQQRPEIFLSSTASRSVLLSTQTSNSVGIRFLSSAVKRPVSDSDHTFLSSAKVKNECSHTSPPSIRLHGVNRDKFTSNYFMYTTYDCVAMWQVTQQAAVIW